MSEALQFGQHPDADQICAFVEQALPSHEREQVLDHLAVCPECRAVVALSQPPEEEGAKPLSIPKRRLWWSGWALAWPAAAAFAALAVFAVYLHRASIGPEAPGANQIAKSNQPAPQTPIGQLAAHSAEPAQGDSQAQVTANSPAPFDDTTAAKTRPSFEAAFTARSTETMPMQGRNSGSLNALVQVSPATAAEASSKKLKLSDTPSMGMTSGVGGGLGYGVGANSSGVAGSYSQQAASIQPAEAAISSAPQAKAVAMQPSVQSIETVLVADAPPIQTESANFDLRQNQMQNAQLKHPLPSRLPVLSIANQTSRIVAIDTSNEVFLSKDEGKHWRPVQAQWAGRAVRAGVIESQLTGFKKDRQAVAGGLVATEAISVAGMNDALNAPARIRANIAGSSLTGKVTDRTGAVIPGAAVSVTESATHAVRTITTNSTGHYLINGLVPGTYQVAAQAPGFEKQELAAVAVASGHAAVADLSLNIGAEAESIAVTADAVAVTADKKALAKRTASSQTVSFFEITTEDGQRWTSADGVTWTHIDSPNRK
jgi:hypothetical protein